MRRPCNDLIPASIRCALPSGGERSGATAGALGSPRECHACGCSATCIVTPRRCGVTGSAGPDSCFQLCSLVIPQLLNEELLAFKIKLTPSPCPGTRLGTTQLHDGKTYQPNQDTFKRKMGIGGIGYHKNRFHRNCLEQTRASSVALEKSVHVTGHHQTRPRNVTRSACPHSAAHLTRTHHPDISPALINPEPGPQHRGGTFPPGPLFTPPCPAFPVRPPVKAPARLFPSSLLLPPDQSLTPPPGPCMGWRAPFSRECQYYNLSVAVTSLCHRSVTQCLQQLYS